ncbi:MAG: SPOR domain-containing protein [Alphaproteobacteria bacterium]|nr:SPOR domain-containing protein [Alphaproteobacteria bacterium]
MSDNFMDDMNDSTDFFDNLRKQVTDENRHAQYQKKSSKSTTGIWLGVLIGTLVAAIIAYGVFGSFISKKDDSQIPVVKKDVADIKVRPDSPGGMNIPDQDKLVYNRITTNTTEEGETVERIMPRAKRPTVVNSGEIISADAASGIKPVDTSNLPTPTTIEDLMKSVDEANVNKRDDKKPTGPFSKFSEMDIKGLHNLEKTNKAANKPKKIAKVIDTTPSKTTVNDALQIHRPERIEIPIKNIEKQKAIAIEKPAKRVKTVAAKTVDKITNHKTVITPSTPHKTTKVAQKPTPKTVPKSKIKSITKPSALSELIAKTSTPSAKPTKLTGWGVQLLASKSKAAVEKSWKTISKKHSVLAGVPHGIVKANLGKKGVYYRLRAGSYRTKAEADRLCKALKARKQDCMVVQNK